MENSTKKIKLNFKYGDIYNKYMYHYPQDKDKIDSVLNKLIEGLNNEFKKSVLHVHNLNITDPLHVYLVSRTIFNSEKLANAKIENSITVSNFEDIDNHLIHGFIVDMKYSLLKTVLIDYTALNKYIVKKIEENNKKANV